MLRNYLVVAWRHLIRHKLYSLINVAGLAIGMAFCVLVLLFVRDEWTYDTFHEHADEIYRIVMTYAYENGETRQTVFTPHALVRALKEECPEIEQTVRFSGERLDVLSFGQPHVRYEDKLFVEGVLFADPQVFQVFSFPLQQGDPQTALADRNGVVLSAEMARKYFGDEEPLGKRLSIRSLWNHDWYDFTVTGVAREIPPNSTIRFGFLLPYARIPDLLHREIDTESWRWSAVTYIRLTDRRLAPVVERKLESLVQSGQLPPVAGGRFRYVRFDLQPLTRMHLHPETPNPRIPGFEPESDPMRSYILAGMALLMLGMAVINFINLAVGRSATRAREVGVRKVVGARRGQLIGQFWGEALLLSAIAIAGGLALAELGLPVFGELVGKDLALEVDGIAFAGLVGLVLLTGLLAGSYPALMLSGFHPVEVLKGRLRVGGPGLFGRGLVVVQLALSVFLVVSTAVMWRQRHFIRTRDLGFDQEQVVLINADDLPEIGGPYAERGGSQAVLRNLLLQHSNILHVSMLRWW